MGGAGRPSRALQFASLCALAASWRRSLALPRRLASFSAVCSAVLYAFLVLGRGLGTVLLFRLGLALAAASVALAGASDDDEGEGEDEEDEDDMARHTTKHKLHT